MISRTVEIYRTCSVLRNDLVERVLHASYIHYQDVGQDFVSQGGILIFSGKIAAKYCRNEISPQVEKRGS